VHRRALALELAARGCDLALAIATRRAADAGRRDQPRLLTKISNSPVDVSEPSQIEAFALAAISVHPGLNIVVNMPASLARQFDEIDQAQMEWLMNIISGRGDVTRLPAASDTPARSPHRQPVEHFRHRRTAGTDGLRRGEIRGARLFGKLADELQMTENPVRVSVVHPGGVATQIALNARTGAGITTMRTRASIERFDNAARTTPAAAGGASPKASRKKPAAHPDRDRCAIHRPGAAAAAAHLLEGACGHLQQAGPLGRKPDSA